MRRQFGVIILFIVFKQFSFGQYYDSGQDPFSIRWKKIESPHFKVIFSEDAISTGKQYAAYLEEIYKSGGMTLGYNPRKISVIIHNQNVYSNGEVVWAPKRMNLYATPPQYEISEIYGKHLALHEFRHVVQIDKINQSSTRFFYYLLGEQAIGLLIGWHIPRWFFEGDAVAYETGASNSGRGRISDFTMKLNAQLAAYGVYSYPKAQFGSYKDFVPSHYDLGYQLISRARLKYGVGIWDSTLNQVAHSPIHPNAFSKGIKKVTGLPERKLYNELMSDIKNESSVADTKSIKKPKDYINYYSPYPVGSSILSYKTSYGDIPRIVITNAEGKDKKIHTPGIIFNQTFSYNDSLMVWNEVKQTRWENGNYNRIVRFDLKSNKKMYLTKKTKAFYSRISPDNSKILSVEVDKALHWTLTIRDANHGEIIDSIGFNNFQPLQPSWSPNMREVVFMLVGENGKSLALINLNSHEITWILHDEYVEMSSPIHMGDAIVIRGIYKGASNYMEYNIITKQWTVLTDVNYGVGEANISQKDFVYTNYTSEGYKLNRVDVDKLTIKPISKPDIFETNLTHLLAKEELNVNLNGLDTTFEVQNYSKVKTLFNIHSWAPLGINIQNIEVGPGVTVMSQNALSTSFLSGGYQYNITDGSHKYFVDYSYKGFYPILSTRFSNTYYQEYLEGEGDTLHFVKYSDISSFTSISFPFNFDRGKWNRKFEPQIAYEYRAIMPSSENSVKLKDPIIQSVYGQLYMYNLLTTSVRDLQSKWGQVLNFRYMISPFNTEQRGQLASGEGWFYFPGVFQNHGLRLYGGYQWKEYGEYSFTDQLNYPFGYQSLHNTQMVSAQANYQFPLWYPDLNVYEYLYFKRIKANAFYQYAAFEYKNSRFDLTSVGGDLTANVHFFRKVIPFEIGLRYAHMITYSDNYYQFLFSANF